MQHTARLLSTMLFCSTGLWAQSLEENPKPGLGIHEFYPSEIQEQLNSVRQNSIRPLELEFPSNAPPQLEATPLKTTDLEPVENSLTTQMPEEKILEPVESPLATQIPEGKVLEPVESPLATQMPEEKILEPVKNSLATQMPEEKILEPVESPLATQMPEEKVLEPVENSLAAQTAEEKVLEPVKNSLATQMPEEKKLAATVEEEPRASNAELASAKKRSERSGRSTQLASPQINVSKSIPFGDPFQLSLHGLIWTYIPGLSEYPTEPKFERRLENLETSFDFTFSKPGRYLLAFSRQYPSTGALEYYSAEIIVQENQADSEDYPLENVTLNEQHIAPKLIADNITSGASASYRISSQVISDVRDSLKNGELESAYETLQNWPESEKGDIYDSAGAAFLDADMHQQAVDMWQRNTTLDGELRDKAIVGIIHASIRADDTAKLLEWLPEFVELADSDPAISAKNFTEIHQTLKNANLQMTQNSAASTILDFYQTYVDQYPDSNSPEILYNMANYYESPGTTQDLRHARQLYMDIQSKYPVARHSKLAQERIDYLNRQFFYVR